MRLALEFENENPGLEGFAIALNYLGAREEDLRS